MTIPTNATLATSKEDHVLYHNEMAAICNNAGHDGAGANSTVLAGSLIAALDQPSAAGAQSISIGFDAIADSDDSIAMGDGAEAHGIGVVAIGLAATSQVGSDYGVAIGSQAYAQGAESDAAVGHGANAAGPRSIALGRLPFTNGDDNIAIGTSAQADGTAANQIAIGTS